MRIVLDASYARCGASGTQVYVDALVGELRALGVEVIAAAGRRGRHLNLAAEAVWQGRLARAARDADVLHHPLPARAHTRVPQVVTVHDLAIERVPDCFNARFRRVARIRHRAAARAAAVIVTPSESTAADVRSRWAIPAERIVVAPHGPGQAPAANRGEARWFLYVGDAEPRKNLGRLLVAYARYRSDAADPLDLVIAGAGAGRAGALGAAAPGAGDAPGVRTVPAPDLADLHRHAAALVIPSLHEGFGLPALEAMHAGTPVLAARTAGLAEVCADAARYCDPRDVESIAAGLRELGGTPPLREELRRRGTARAAEFSWRRCAEAHLRAYRLAATASPQGARHHFVR